MDILFAPWPWYVSGPLVGLMVPLLLWIGSRAFGLSSSLQHVCAAVLPKDVAYLTYDWRREGMWLLVLVAGLILGGGVGGWLLRGTDSVAISPATVTALSQLGVADIRGLAPASLFSWERLLTLPGLILLVAGGFLVGFGTRWANGCTSGHGITGMANLQWPSLLAVCGFFAGGLLGTHVLLPWLLK